MNSSDNRAIAVKISKAEQERIKKLVSTQPSTKKYVMPKPVLTPKSIQKHKGKKATPLYCQKDLLSILGTAESMPAAPYGNPEFEIWGVAVCSTYPACKRMDVQFEMHTDGYWQDKNVLTRLQQTKVPIYMHDKQKTVPMSLRYPIEEITESYGRYFTNSIAYMLALAYHSYKLTGKPKHVAMFGVHMAATEEYTDQRPCCEYWLGVMRGAGMDVVPSPGGAVLANKSLYGYENYHPVCYEFRQRIQALQNGFNQAKAEHEKWRYQMAKNEGGMTENQFWLRKFQTGNIATDKKKEKK